MEKIAPLTGLRGIAAYAVLIAHAVDASVSGRGLPHSIAVGLAYFGMSLFFVLSGFVICYNYENKVLSPYGRWQFFGARFARLFPMYAFVVIVYALPVLDHSTPLVVVTHATLTQSMVQH
jgi:peptidoglycan/LPS O-acetylase OafA/YrhL